MDRWTTVHLVVFGTANGSTEADQALKMYIAKFQDDNAEAYILASTSPVLSVGAWVMHKGYRFFLVPSKKPCTVTPAMIIV